MPALLVALLVMTTSASMTSTALHRYAAERTRGERELALHVAESGLDVAFYEVQTGLDLAKDGVGVTSGVVKGGVYSTTIAPKFAGGGTYTITATGAVGGERQTATMVVTSTGGFGDGLIGLNGVTFSGGPHVDSYDATIGSYASQVKGGKGGHAGDHGNVASNGDVSGSGSGAIYGDATPGPAGKFTGSFKVSGSTAPAKALIVVDPYVYAPPSPAKKAWTGSGTLTSGAYHYTSLSLASKDLLTLKGDVTLYVDGAFKIAGSASIVVAKGAHVTIQQGDKDFSVAGGGIVNTDQLPASLVVESATLGTVSISGTSAFFGSVHCPYASFSKVGTADFYGAVVAAKASVNGTGWIHYDTSLAQSGAPTFRVAMVSGK